MVRDDKVCGTNLYHIKKIRDLNSHGSHLFFLGGGSGIRGYFFELRLPLTSSRGLRGTINGWMDGSMNQGLGRYWHCMCGK